jgi:hypothetical protein
MSYFCDENESVNARRPLFRYITKRPPAHPIDFFDRVEAENNPPAPHNSHIRPLKRIRRSTPIDSQAQKPETSTHKIGLAEFNEQYLARYLAERDKYSQSMRNFN